jgi:hypothetical protein
LALGAMATGIAATATAANSAAVSFFIVTLPFLLARPSVIIAPPYPPDEIQAEL